MTIWAITGFDAAPHWEIAFVEAETAAEAANILSQQIHVESDQVPDGVWEPQPIESWKVEEAKRPLLFILGGGCRS